MLELKHRVYIVLEGRNWADPTVRWVNAGLVALIALNVVALVLESVGAVREAMGGWLRLFEVFSVLVFTVEYVLRVWSITATPRFAGAVRGRLRFAATPMALIDLLAILPFWLPFLGIDLRVLRMLRMFRLFRVLKLARYSQALQTFGVVLMRKREELTTILIVLGMLLLLVSSLMYYVENEAQPDKFSSIPATMWWGIATLTTVGYGDIVPVTGLGRVLGALIAVLGIGIFALPTGILGAAFVDEIQQQKATHRRNLTCPHCGEPLDDPAADEDETAIETTEHVG